MWGKVGFHRSRKPVIGPPKLMGRTLDDNAYQALSPGSGTQSSKKLPRTQPLPPKTSDSAFSANRPDSGHRAASSVYSRETVDHDRQHSATSSCHNDGRLYEDPGTASDSPSVEISPPDSPISFSRAHRSGESSRVSSLEIESKQAFDGDQSTRKFTSHFPILRKRAGSSHPDDKPSTQTPSSQNSNTRWDGFSGAPTTSHSDKNVHSSSFGIQPTGPSKLAGWAKNQHHLREESTSGRQRSSSKTDNQFSLAVREPWKGPSGRSPMINPIQEKPRDKSSPRVQQPKSSDRSRENDWTYLGLVPSVVTTITGGAENTTTRVERHQASVPKKPVSPAITKNDAPPQIDLPKYDLETTLAELKSSTGDQAQEPVSRFSATTCGTTDTGSSTPSPRGSIDAASQNTDNAPSIMSRKRPVPSALALGTKPARKPTPSQSVDNGKELPQCPPEQQAQTRIEMLEAKRDNLARRRANINTIIHELTQVIQPSSIAYDMAARDEVKKTVASLNNELDEIKKEEHEIGMKLFRAWKKRDERDLNGGETSLWVRRVTN